MTQFHGQCSVTMKMNLIPQILDDSERGNTCPWVCIFLLRLAAGCIGKKRVLRWEEGVVLT